MSNEGLNNFEPKVVLADSKTAIPLSGKVKRVFKAKVSAFQAIIIISLIFFIAYYIVLNLYSEFMVERILSEEELFQLDKKIQLMMAAEKLPTIAPYEPTSFLHLRSFGDIFSSLSHINRQLTDMYWDGQVGAFLLPPQLSLKKANTCNDEACGQSVFDRKWQGLCNPDACLERVDNSLFYANLPLNLPKELENENILSIDLGGLGRDFYLGIVIGEEFDEKFLVYRFDGENFYPIITDDITDLNILTGDRKGGRMAIGGTVDDYLIVYAGYFAKVLRVRNDSIEDISEFLPLRMTTRGHYPQIIYSPSSYSFYICNTDLRNPSLVKIWFDRQKNIIGSADLRQILFSTSPRRLICDYGNENAHLNLYTLEGETWVHYEFLDQGFDQSIVRQVISRDINSNSELVKGVYASSFNIYSEKTAEDTYQLFFSNNGEDYLPAVYNRWFLMETEGNKLVWRIIFKTGDYPYYSPWFSDFRNLNYEFIPEQ